MPIIAIIFTTPRRPKHKIIISWNARGLVPRMQGDGSTSKSSGIMEVAVWLCISLLLGLWVYYPTMLCWF